MTATWREILSGLEADLDAFESLLDAVEHGELPAGDLPVPAAWQPPAGLTALPDELQGEVEDLLQRMAAVQVRAGAERARLGSAIGDTGRRREAADRYHAQAGPGDGAALER